MKIAILQLDSQIGHVKASIVKADDLLADLSTADGLDLLVLPELAFTGYNFSDLESIKPYLEPTAAGPSTEWAVKTAKRLSCHVIVGYPEVSLEVDINGSPINYNATVTVGRTGEVLATYRKSFLYYTDENWAAEGSGFYHGKIGNLGNIAHAVCMDINPKEFTAPWTAYEFANHCLSHDTDLTVLSMAWLTHTPQEELKAWPKRPDLDTVPYWINRFVPFLQRATEEEDSIVVFANRCGTEINSKHVYELRNGKVVEMSEPNVNYAGSSCVMRFGKDRVDLHGILGQNEEGLLIVDTDAASIPLLRSRDSGDELDEP